MAEETAGPRCGNNPGVHLSDGDRQAVAEFKAYLAARRKGMTPAGGGTVEESTKERGGTGE